MIKALCSRAIICLLTALLITVLIVPQSLAAENAAVTRRDFVSAVNEAFGFYTVLGDEEKFTDIPIGSSDYLEFAAARRAGYLTGYPDGSAGPDNAVTRAEAAVMLDRIVGFPRLPLTSFTAATDIPDWSFESVNAVIKSGILTPDTDGYFRPEEALSSEALSIIIDAVNTPEYVDRTGEMLEITSFDGYKITGRLTAPSGDNSIDKLVIYVHGTGPNTYLMRRQNSEAGYRFNVLAFYADKFVEDGTAFFSYSTRGVALGENPNPLAPDAVIDAEGYRTYTPQNVAMDLINIIDTLKEDPRLSDAKVILYGASEGTIISTLAVSEYGAEADALLHAGYCNDTMKDILEYQMGGEMSYFNYTIYFDAFGQDSISKEQFDADPNGIAAQLAAQGADFSDVDLNSDGVITLADFERMMSPLKDGLFDAIEQGDDQWIADNLQTMIPPLPIEWFEAHFELAANEDVMVGVDIPVLIFQGTYDANCPVQGVYDVQARFEAEGKDNLTVCIYESYDHSLNLEQWLFGKDNEAMEDIFVAIEGL